MFDRDRFIEDCRAAVAADPSHKAVREVVARAVSARGEVLKALGDPKRADVQTLYRSDTLVESPYDMTRTREIFEAANRFLAAA